MIPHGKFGVPRVAIITEIPTPYRQPVLDRLIKRSDVHFDLLYLGRTQRDRAWNVELPDSDHIQVLPGRQLCWRGHHTVYFNWGIERILNEMQYDVLILGGYAQPALWTALRFAWKHHVPYVVWTESHHYKRRSRWRQRLKVPWLQRIYSRSKANLVMGEWSKEYVMSYGAPPTSIYRFPNSVDAPTFAREVDHFRPQKEQTLKALGITSGVVALFVGAFIFRKGIDTLLAAASLLRRRNIDIHLLCIGSGNLEPSLHLANGSEPMRGRVHIAGYVQPADLPKYYAAADFLVLPSREEPYGAVACEALAAGLPLICSTAVGAAPDCLQDETNGFLFPPGDIPKLAEKIARLVTDGELRNRMGYASRARSLDWTHASFEENVVETVKTAAA